MKNSLFLLLSFVAFVSLSSCRISKKKKQKYIAGLYQEMKDSFPNTELILFEDSIKMIFPDDIIFEIGSAQIKTTFFERLTKLSTVINKYEKVNILINGHTDNTGEEQVNKQLSKLRAESAKQILVKSKVYPKRIFVWGFGARMPRDSNDTEQGKARNRRVEFVLLYPKERI
ncbi:MAG: OmpA family protein [Bacteroidetes bacterium]|jgi:outer membrane protein OmpA-like peptidoglycan-associated protein|nr:OmpA family protein [Bacteroidota bacterium]MBK8145497.1 OmpA family protein [Bacteroidota bacterium]MBP6315256.1 OmpA family protein [Chitinophagaceae bacterium]